MRFMSYHTDSGTGICANIHGNQESTNHWHAPVVEDVLKHASGRLIKMNCSWNWQDSQLW